MKKLTDPKDRYQCLTEAERTQADKIRKLVSAIIDLFAACDTLMDEVVGKGATNWDVVNNALCGANKMLKEIVGKIPEKGGVH